MAGVVRLAMCAVALYTAPIKRLPDQAVWSHDGMVNISDRLDSNVEEAFARRARGVANDALLHLIEGRHHPLRSGDGHLAILEGDANIVNGDRRRCMINSWRSATNLDGEEEGARCVVLDLQDAAVAYLRGDVRRGYERAVDEAVISAKVGVLEETIHGGVLGRQEIVYDQVFALEVEEATAAVSHMRILKKLREVNSGGRDDDDTGTGTGEKAVRGGGRSHIAREGIVGAGGLAGARRNNSGSHKDAGSGNIAPHLALINTRSGGNYCHHCRFLGFVELGHIALGDETHCHRQRGVWSGRWSG